MAYPKAVEALNKSAKGKEAKKKIHGMRVKRAANGGHIITHEDEHGQPIQGEHIASDDDALREHMEDNYMQPNPGEAEADAGQSGVPPTAAQQ